MEPTFRLKLVYPDGTDVVFDGGGAIERHIITTCRDAIIKRGVGIFTTEAHVARDIEEGIKEAFYDLKHDSLRVL